MRTYLSLTGQSVNTWTKRAILAALVLNYGDPKSKQKRMTRHRKSFRSVNCALYLALVILLLSGDINPHPGPRISNPCGFCSLAVRNNQAALCCDICNTWIHRKCLNMSLPEYRRLANSTCDWYCTPCTLPPFSDSFYRDMENGLFEIPNSTITTETSDDDQSDYLDTLKEIRKKYFKNFIISHLHINSIQNKFEETKDMLKNRLMDCLILSETKIDSSNPSAQFHVEDYRQYRQYF